MKKFSWILLLVLVIVGGGFTFVNYYEYIMSKDVSGTVTGVQRLDTNTVIAPYDSMGNKEQLFSFAVAVKSQDGEIFSASTEDRQWAIVETNFCVRARFYPYPFWDLKNSGTFHNARLLKIYDCNQMPKSN